jgi:hypothetical protein
MAGVVSKLPLGLLGFLGIKNAGEYPRELAGFYQPTLDLTSLLIGSNFEEFNFALGALPAAGNAGSYSTALAVPQTEVWVVTLLCHRITSGVGEAWNGYIALRRFPVSSPNVVHALCDRLTTAVGASEVGVPQVVQPRGAPLVLGPGDEVCAFTTAITGAPQARPHIRFARFPL